MEPGGQVFEPRASMIDEFCPRHSRGINGKGRPHAQKRFNASGLRMARMDLSGRIVVITGASSGIGRAAAVMAARHGASVALVARDESRLREATSEVARHGTAAAFACDVADEHAVSEMARRVSSELGPADILVNNAGFAIYGTVSSLDAAVIRAHMETNYFGAVHCTKAFMPHMLEVNRGKIVNVASVAASIGLPGIAAYCASKFAMLGFSESLRAELAKTGVGITTVSPIAVRTPFFDHASFAGVRRYSPMSLDVQTVARAIMRAIGSRRGEITVPGAARLAIWAKHTFPWAFNALVSSAFGKN